MERLKVFIVREYWITDTSYRLHVDEGSIFFSYTEAKRFLLNLINLKNSEYRLENYRIGIKELTLENHDLGYKEYIYNYKGEQVEEYSSEPKKYSIDDIKIEEYIPTGKFRIGDIVCIAPRIKNRLSPFVQRTYGVIVEVPLLGKEWIELVKETDEIDISGAYTVCFISEYGLFDHEHIFESVLELSDMKIPKELEFLEIYSKHITQCNILSNEVAKQILKERIFVKKVKRFDFDKMEIVK